MTTETAANESTLAGIVGADYVRPAADADAVAGVTPRWIVAPGDEGEVASVLRAATAAGWAVLPRGGGTKLGWGAPPRRAGVLLDLYRLDRVLEHAWGDMTVTVEAGCPIDALQAHVAEHGQRLALDPLWPERATAGGGIATNDSGALRLRYGGVRDQLLGITAVLADGTVARSGGKVVKNVAGYDLPKLFTGAYGTLGVLTQATFRLYPLPPETATHTLTGAPAALAALLPRLVPGGVAPVAAQLEAGSGGSARLAVVLEGVPDALAEQARRLRTLLLGSGVEEWEGAAGDPVAAREALWAQPGLVLRISIQPADGAALLTLLDTVSAAHDVASALVLQATGAGYLRLASAHDRLPAALAALRDGLALRGGSAVAVGVPLALRGRIDVWGPVGDALPLMRAVKAQFDPTGTLNPGRFVGGI